MRAHPPLESTPSTMWLVASGLSADLRSCRVHATCALHVCVTDVHTTSSTLLHSPVVTPPTQMDNFTF